MIAKSNSDGKRLHNLTILTQGLLAFLGRTTKARANLSSLWPRLTLAVRLLYTSEMVRTTFVDLLARANLAVVDSWKTQRSRELISAFGAVYYDYKIWSS